MASGRAVVNGWIKRIESLPKEARPEALRPIVEADLRRTIAAGTTPHGVPWKPTVDGGRALVNAGAALQVIAPGDSVVAIVTGPEAIHNYGTKKDPKRQILPTILPQTLTEKLKAGITKAFRRALGLR